MTAAESVLGRDTEPGSPHNAFARCKVFGPTMVTLALVR